MLARIFTVRIVTETTFLYFYDTKPLINVEILEFHEDQQQATNYFLEFLNDTFETLLCGLCLIGNSHNSFYQIRIICKTLIYNKKTN